MGSRVINWGVHTTLSSIFSEPNLKPIYQYALLSSAHSALETLCALESSRPLKDIKLAYEKAQCCLIEVMPHYPSLNVTTIVTDLSKESVIEIKKRANALCTSLEQTMHSEFPSLNLIDQIASHFFSSTTNRVNEAFSTASIFDWGQEIATKAGSHLLNASTHFVQDRAAALNPPLKGLQILEPFKHIAPVNRVTPEMIKRKIDELSNWCTAFASMKCINALFDFHDVTNPVHCEEQIRNAARHGCVYKWAAKKMYQLIYAIFRGPLQRLFNTLYHAFIRWQQKDTESRVLDLLHLIEEWLSSVSQGYSKVAHLPPEQWGGQRIVDMLDEQIRIKLHGEKESDLTHLCNKLVSAGLELFSIDWINSLEKSCLPWPIKKVIQLSLFLPQLFCNIFLKSIGRFILVWCIDIPGMLDASLKAPATNTPPSRFSLQMKEWSYQHVGSMVNHADERMQREGEKISEKIQKDMHACLQVLLEVLHKSQYPTVEKLRNYIHSNHTLKEKVLKEMEEGALPIAMPVVALGLGAAIEKALGSQEVLKTAYDLLSIWDGTLTLVPIARRPTDDTRALVDALLERTACYGLNDSLAQRIAMKQATGFVNDITVAFGERAFLRSLVYKGLATSLEIWKDTSQQPLT